MTDLTIDGTARNGTARNITAPPQREKMIRLTDNQERFVREFLRWGVAARAYRLAYKIEDGNPNIYMLGSRMLASVKIQSRLKQLRAHADALTIARVVEEFDQNRNHALELGQIGAANGAVVGKARVAGFIPRSNEGGGTTGMTINVYLLAEDKTVG